MEKPGKEAWVTYLEHDCLIRQVPDVGQPFELKITIRPHDIMCMMKVSTSEGPMVCFTGAGSLRGISAKVNKIFRGEGGRWRRDRYYGTSDDFGEYL
jgi:hypothetical protein